MKTKREYIVKRNGEHLAIFDNCQDAQAQIEVIKKDDLSYKAYQWACSDKAYHQYVIDKIDNSVYDIEIRDTRL